MRERLGAVLAEIERLLAIRIGIGAARAFEAARLVHRHQRARALGDDALLEQHLRRRRRRTPAARGAIIGLIAGPVLSHDSDSEGLCDVPAGKARRSEEHTSELQSLMRLSYAVFYLKKKMR